MPRSGGGSRLPSGSDGSRAGNWSGCCGATAARSRAGRFPTGKTSSRTGCFWRGSPSSSDKPDSLASRLVNPAQGAQTVEDEIDIRGFGAVVGDTGADSQCAGDLDRTEEGRAFLDEAAEATAVVGAADAKTDGAEGDRGEKLELRQSRDPAFHVAGDFQGMVDSLHERPDTESAQGAPDFQSLEVARELGTVVQEIGEQRIVFHGEVRRGVAEGAAQRLAVTNQHAPGFEGGEEQLVRVEGHGIGAGAGQQLRLDSVAQDIQRAVSAIHVEPQAFAAAEIGQRIEGIDGSGVHGSGGGHHAEGRSAGGAILLYGVGQEVEAHAEVAVHGDPAQVIEAESEEDGGFVDSAVRLGGGIEDQWRCLPLKAAGFEILGPAI